MRWRSLVSEEQRPIADKRVMLEIQSKLLEDSEMPDDFDVDLVGESTPKLPVIYVKCDSNKYESAKGFVCKISPMRNGRFRLMDYVQNSDEYFSHDQLEQLHNAAMKIVSSAPKKT